MKKLLNVSLILFLFFFLNTKGYGQSEKIKPSLVQIGESSEWQIVNREVDQQDDSIYLNRMSGNGLVYHNSIMFSDGIIEIDLKGKDVNGESFIGIAFHIQDESTYEAIYFRPFNFQNPNRNKYAVQYISHPIYTWDKLRNEQPGKYENKTEPTPDPNEWFNARIEVKYPEVKIYINGSNKPSLEISQLGNQKIGYVGLWVGNSSDGHFKNLTIQAVPGSTKLTREKIVRP